MVHLIGSMSDVYILAFKMQGSINWCGSGKLRYVINNSYISGTAGQAPVPVISPVLFAFKSVMHMAAPSLLLALLLVVGSNATTTPSSECSYLVTYRGSSQLLPSLVPSVSSQCVAEYNNGSATQSCCQTLYSVLSKCTSPNLAEAIVSSQCGQYAVNSCAGLQYNSNLAGTVYSACDNATYCSPSCRNANGRKALCGQQPIAPCSTALNSGSVAVPSSECAYFRNYLDRESPSLTLSASLLPSLNAVCRTTLANAGFESNTCIPECQSLYALIASCHAYGGSFLLGADYMAAFYCGKFNNQNCSSLYSNYTYAFAVQDLL